jgi:hypothetical protein
MIVQDKTDKARLMDSRLLCPCSRGMLLIESLPDLLYEEEREKFCGGRRHVNLM